MTAQQPSAVRELLYATDEAEHLVFVPRQVADDVLRARGVLSKCATWGHARKALSPNIFHELVDNLVAPSDQPPADHDPLNKSALDGDWPALDYNDISRWLPEEAVERFGESWSGRLDSGTHLPAESEDDLIDLLRAQDILCRHDDEVLGLFVA